MESIAAFVRSAVDEVTTVHHGDGHYHETYEKVDGEWRIATIKLTRLRVDTTMA